jgi:hypothetical protein
LPACLRRNAEIDDSVIYLFDSVKRWSVANVQDHQHYQRGHHPEMDAADRRPPAALAPQPETDADPAEDDIWRLAQPLGGRGGSAMTARAIAAAAQR